MDFHDVANIFPMMGEEEFKALVADIKVNGQIEPVWMYQGKIIDGRNRYKACKEIGIIPQVREWNGDEASLLTFILSLNLQRRHLTSSQKAILAVEVEKYLAIEASQRMLAGKRVDPVQKSVQGKASDQAAHIVGTNRQYTLEAKRIMERAPEIGEAVRRGDLTIPDATIVARMSEGERQSVLEKISSVDNRIYPNKTKRAIELVQKEAQEKMHQQKMAEYQAGIQAEIAKRATPEYQAMLKQEHQRQVERTQAEKKEQEEREISLLADIKERLNDPDNEAERRAFYKAADDANRQLKQTALAYMIFLSRLDRLVGKTATDDWQTLPRDFYHSKLYQCENIVRGIQRGIDESNGHLNGMLERCENDFRLSFHVKGVSGHSLPPIDIEDLRQWIDDPSLIASDEAGDSA